MSYRLSCPEPGPDAEADAERDAGFVSRGLLEDRAMAASVQRGLTSGANETLDFGRFEGAIGHFHRQLHELLGT